MEKVALQRIEETNRQKDHLIDNPKVLVVLQKPLFK